MARNRFFNVALDAQVATPATAAVVPPVPPGATPPRETVGVITAPQTALTFAGAPAFVVTILTVLKQVTPFGPSTEKLLGLGLSLLFGLSIYVLSETNAKTPKEKAQAFLLALVNSFAIAASVLGITAGAA